MTKNIKETLVKVLEPFAAALQGDIRKVENNLSGLDSKIEAKFQKVDQQLIKLTDDMSYVRGSVQILQAEVVEIKQKLENIVYRHEFEELREKIKIIEKKLGIRH